MMLYSYDKSVMFVAIMQDIVICITIIELIVYLNGKKVRLSIPQIRC